MQVGARLADIVRAAAAYADLDTQNLLVSICCTCLQARWVLARALLQGYSPECCAARLQMPSPPPHDASDRLGLQLTAY
jgi:hypothetical protein